MGFAWHKLIPRPPIGGDYECPPPCTATGDFTTEICWCPGEGGGQISTVCDTPTCREFTIEGPLCNDDEFPTHFDNAVLTETAGPRERRLYADLVCTRANTGDSATLNCAMGRIAEPPIIPYYYRTPDSPNSMPDTIKCLFLCLKYKSFTVPDRLMVISARNRYKYAGMLSGDPGCTENISTVIPLWNRQFDAAGTTGIKQAEMSLGRDWPLPDSILNLPLFGADTSSNPTTTKQDASPCPPPYPAFPCGGSGCFTVRANRQFGHYTTSNLVHEGQNGIGRYSFQCFNPTAIYADNDGYNTDQTPIPTCSVWGLVEAIKQKVLDFVGDWDTVSLNYPNLYSAFLNFEQKNPSGYTDHVSNVRYCLNALSSELSSSVTARFAIPNVFLWDPIAFDAASTTIDKWKHIYIIGNANVVFDTYCFGTTSDKVYSFVIPLDEVSHKSYDDAGSGYYSDDDGSARMIMFWGCSSDTQYNSNRTSQAQVDLTALNCVPPLNEQNLTLCERCYDTPDDISGTEPSDTYHNCYYRGHAEGLTNADCGDYDGWPSP